MTRINYIVWGLLVLFGGFVIRESLELSYYGTDFGPGPGFFSFWLGVLLIALSAVQLVGTYRRPFAALPDGFLPNGDGLRRMLCIFGALLAALLVMNRLGFSATVLLFCVFLFRTLGRQAWWVTVVLSLIGSFGLAYIFGLLQVMLPTGLVGM